jgi:acetyltransferase-like isoleucine patch superfamily enzyme
VSQHIDEDEVRAITGAWDYRSLPDNVQIGSDCFLARRDSFRRFRSTRDQGLILGNRVIVYTWAEFNIEPSGFLSVGDDSILVGPVFMCAESIRIGRRVVISYNVTIADSDFHPLDAASRKADAVANAPEGSAANRPAIVSDPVTIDDDAWVGIGAIILKGVRIGKAARIGAGAVVTSDVPAGASVAGNPARIVDAGPES